MSYLKSIVIIITCWLNSVNAENIYDEARDRTIPVEIVFPNNIELCSTHVKCPVAFISAGYGVSHTKYTFLSKQFNQLGYLVIAIGHELPSDPALSISGNLYETRSENWSRGAKTLDFLKNFLSKRYINYDFENLTLIGHSNGGDISAWLGNENKRYIEKIITLDHRRVRLPRNSDFQILSIRASDFPADKGVLPTATEQEKYGSCVVSIAKAKHNDITDFGPEWLKERINSLINNYLSGFPCSKLTKTEQTNKVIDTMRQT
ncbi:alpha/beta hydrolase [Pseudoalteromonas sp. MMG005]|uniref:alpha/beta hydrolase n=1 Tax=Pseudoalteromonas sp. MMG005 TaxID=2822682 RepID=UPI001B39E05E|nr:alpha/beta hydrolase [Pseudoalteromonas sp. MMG005]MBQ4845044.1 alpha/beta hydrolase [Pseudoalteromonas sp. MMG005]